MNKIKEIKTFMFQELYISLKKSRDILPELIFQTEKKYNMYKNLIYTHKRKSRPVMVPSIDHFIFSF